jgi:Fe2+ transport system protein FeoA
MKKQRLSLTQLPHATSAQIVTIEGGPNVWECLNEVGLHRGDRVTVIRQAPLRGPLLVQCGGLEIAIGRHIAAKIFVEVAA